MQSIQQELPGVINELLQGETVQKYYTPSCRLTHSLVVCESRHEIECIFRFWITINAFLSAQVHEIIFDEDELKCWVLFTQNVRGVAHIPFLSFDLSMSSLLYFSKEKSDSSSDDFVYKICKQVDFHSFESIVYTMPWIGWIAEHVFRKWQSWCLLYGFFYILSFFCRISGIKKKQKDSGRVIREYRGRSLAPYNPHM